MTTLLDRILNPPPLPAPEQITPEELSAYRRAVALSMAERFCEFCGEPCEISVSRDGDGHEEWWVLVSGPPCNHGEPVVDCLGRYVTTYDPPDE